MKKRWLILMAFLGVLAVGWKFNNIKLTDGLIVPVRNKSGGALSKGQIVVWDATQISVVATVVTAGDPDTLTVATSLSAELGYYKLRSQSYSLADACTLETTGLCWTGDIVDTVIHTETGVMYSTQKWRKVTQVRLLGAEEHDSCDVNAVIIYCNERHPAGVTTTASAANKAIAGVVYTAMADNKTGWIVAPGAIIDVKVNCATTEGLPGMYIETINAAGKGRPNATPVAGKGLGKLLDAGNTDGTYKVIVCPAY